ncbi:PREDICTED: uncharacterized protein LOC108768976 [Trachymyrmex cornetzi]|uniref:uncharacterized protein LOC108768976 n=1 Tax=Trachymyrmex cornetzi TaxID=471704 RepID=UPI00084ED317|nr:PREDICTED: uncharacterized protein LOC108768976 [Trachymyrmex cornetzi]
MTGGGSAPVQPNDPVIEFMDATNPNLDVEIDCAYDSTAVFEKEDNVKMYYKSAKGTLIIQDEKEEKDKEDEEDVINTVDIYDQYDHSVPAVSRKTPLQNRTSPNITNIYVMKTLMN